MLVWSGVIWYVGFGNKYVGLVRYFFEPENKEGKSIHVWLFLCYGIDFDRLINKVGDYGFELFKHLIMLIIFNRP